MKTGKGWTQALLVAALAAGCGTATGGGGGGGAAGQDVAPDLALSFGGPEAPAATDTGGGGGDTAALEVAIVDDSGSGSDDAVTDAPGSDVVSVDDTQTPDIPGFFDDTAVADSGTKDSGTKDSGAPKDTGGSTADVSGTCGNGSCGAGETCQNCAVDCPCTPCNPLTSAGCKSGQQCYVTDTGLQCGGAGAVTDGTPCKFLNDCSLGSMCVGGLCRTICATAGTSLGCSAPATCEELGTATGAIGYNLGACFAPDNCNLITSSGCPTGFACMPGSSGKQCTQAGTVGLDGACTSVADCAIGFLCLNNGATSGTCKKRCNTTDATTCPSGLTCGGITIGSPPVLVGENFGVCDKP